VYLKLVGSQPKLRVPVAPWVRRENACGAAPYELGPPLSIGQAARLIGCSAWTVRQTLIPRGLPHFRFKAHGRIVFYQDQIVRWIEKQQGQ